MSKTKPKSGRSLIRLRRELKRHGITQLAIASAARVSPAHVCNVLAGRDVSRDVLDAAQRLLSDQVSAAS